MSRIGEALERAAATGHTSDRRIDVIVERPSASVGAASDLASYVEEGSPASTAQAPGREPAVLTNIRTPEPTEHSVSRESKLLVAQDLPPVAIEQYRRLAGTLHDLQVERGLKTLMVSSALPREGKTLTVTNLALTLSHSYRRKVLLIDADLRHPSVHEVFGLRNRAGLADVVRTGGRQTPVIDLSECLSVLTAGHHDTNPLAQLTSTYVEDFVRAAAQQFDWVLMDTPPIGLISDAQLVARMCEGALFVVAAGVTPYKLVQRGMAELGEERIVGVVLNRMQQQDVPNGNHYGTYYG